MQRWDGSIGTFSRAVCTACDDTTHPGGLSVSTSGASGYHQSLVLHASVRRECQTTSVPYTVCIGLYGAFGTSDTL